MNLCPKCNHSPWPFVLVVVIATVSGFMTWLTLGLSVVDDGPRLIAAAVVFVAVGATLLHYVLTCLKRHCRHEEAQRAVRRQPAVQRNG